MKEFFKSKFSKERVSKFFDKEGFYIVLFLCVCIVAITAVWVSRNGAKNNQNVTDANKTKAPISVETKETSTPNKDQKVDLPKANETMAPKVEEKEVEAEEKNTKVAATPAKPAAAQPANVKFDNPLKDGFATANVVRGYSAEELVLFDSLGEWRTHTGIDVKGIEGTEVLAVADGKVVDIRNDNEFQDGLGWVVEVEHANGYKSVYGNLCEKIEVKKNQTVKKGQLLGSIGRTSIFENTNTVDTQSIGHLHFEILKKNAKGYEAVDPNKYLTLQN